jgi:hypothetical protein
MLGPLQYNGGLTLTHLPQENSEAIDNGQCPAGVTADQCGQPRPQGLACDAGAVERQPSDQLVRIFMPVVQR